jgi:hypothetical protein
VGYFRVDVGVDLLDRPDLVAPEGFGITEVEVLA